MNNSTYYIKNNLLIFFIIGNVCILSGQCFDQQEFEQVEDQIGYLDRDVMDCLNGETYNDLSEKVNDWIPAIKAYKKMGSSRVSQCKKILEKEINQKLKINQQTLEKIVKQEEETEKAISNVEKLKKIVQEKELAANKALEELKKAQDDLKSLIKSTNDEDKRQQQEIDKAKEEIDKMVASLKQKQSSTEKAENNLKLAQKGLNSLNSTAIEPDKKTLTFEIRELEKLLNDIDKI